MGANIPARWEVKPAAFETLDIHTKKIMQGERSLIYAGVQLKLFR
jgi:hypothetical protein